MNNSNEVRPAPARRSQRGSGDTGTLLTVMVICGLVSAALIVLNWVKSVKDERLNRDYSASHPIKEERQNDTYQVEY